MMIITESNCVLRTVDCCVIVGGVMSITTALVIHNGEKLLIFVVRKFGAGCLRS